ncbi:MAG: CinA family nicotinamide mononucleotide deamidase-related protein, partial [Deltaproteobacteria bacterium]|nr:CinA family nicotinamide mononucleotide deamidase-related protein [Deltaproteobacteria bacterium]
AAGKADVVVVTGGLGPTEDDLSARAAARAAGDSLVLDAEALAWIESLFKAAGRKMHPANEKQAWLPKTASRLDNPLGTAPGFAMDIGGARFFFVPGVPREMERMVAEEVIPRVRLMLGDRHGMAFSSAILRTFGGTEARVGELVSGMEKDVPGVKVGLRALFPEVQVKLYARAQSREEVLDMLDRAGEAAAARLGHLLFSRGEDLEAVVGGLLQQKEHTLALAESCTGGLVGHKITSVSGSSAYFLLSAVTYANAAKACILGVDKEAIAKHGAVSQEVAAQMAEGAKRAVGADWGLSTTGIAGPTGGTEKKPAGMVCIGLAGPEKTTAHTFMFPFHRRRENKEVFAWAALDLLRRRLSGLPDPVYG